MSRKSGSLVSKALRVIALLAGIGGLGAVDVSHFLDPESGTLNVAWGSPGGVAYDGTNFLIAAQSTNGTIMAFRLATNSIMQGYPLDLGRTGGVPRVAFDGGNYLVAWPDFSDLPSDIYGQFIRPDGTVVGSPFLIEKDVDASELGGLAFDGTNYLAVWETNARSSNAVSTVQGRFITPAGGLPGSSLEVSNGTTDQKFPDVAWNGQNYLVIWTGRTDGTNEWNLRGRMLNRDGILKDSLIISESPAQQPWPPTLASDGTNWLAAWTRESGPYQVLNSNLWLPMLYGRIVGRDGAVSGHEVQIRWGGLGQFKPKSAFNGENYLVGWTEKERIDRYWQPAVRQLNGSGEPITAEFGIQRMLNCFPLDPPGMAMGAGAGRFLVVGESLWFNAIWESIFVRVNRVFDLRNLIRLPTGETQFDLVGPRMYSYGLEATTNFLNWSPLDYSLWGAFNVHPPGRITVPATQAGAGDRGFFRAFDGQTLCRENLRLIALAKDHWALEHNKDSLGEPADEDLFGPGRYLPSKPVCPNGGVYNPDFMYTLPFCSLGGVAGHTF